MRLPRAATRPATKAPTVTDASAAAAVGAADAAVNASRGAKAELAIPRRAPMLKLPAMCSRPI